MILPPPDESSQRTIKRSRVLSYVLVAVAAVVLSLRPDLFGDPQTQPWHALLHVWRIAVGLLLGVAALAVQVVVGVQWRRRLGGAGDD
jgi:predicted membrane protein